MKAINPFPSFSISLPDDVAEDQQTSTVASYWIKGDSCLLQVSCFRRDSSDQVSARQRLAEKIEMDGDWKPFPLPHEVRVAKQRQR
jgi:hypothetical protein